MTVSIDTLSAAKALRGAGFDEAGAEAIVAVVRQASELPSLDHLATKDDLAGVKRDLGGAIGESRHDLEAKISELRHDLEKTAVSLKLFVASTVLGGAAMIVLAQIITKAIGISA